VSGIARLTAARPLGALVYKGGLELTDEHRAELRKELDRAHTGRRMRGGRCCCRAGSTGGR
jgi:hypothetical protein